MEKRNLTRKNALNIVGVGMFVVAGVIAIITLVMSTQIAEGGWAEFLHALDKMQEFIQSLDNRWLLALAITALYVLRSVVPIPFPFIFMVTGVMFRSGEALVINTLGYCVVLLITYWFGESIGGGAALKRLKRYDNIQKIISHHGKTQFWVLVALRIVPGVPINSVSQFYGGMKFPIHKFIMASVIGFFPKIWTYTVMGGNISQPFTWNFMGPVIFLLILSGIVTLIVNITLEKKKGDNEDVKNSES